MRTGSGGATTHDVVIRDPAEGHAGAHGTNLLSVFQRQKLEGLRRQRVEIWMHACMCAQPKKNSPRNSKKNPRNSTMHSKHATHTPRQAMPDSPPARMSSNDCVAAPNHVTTEGRRIKAAIDRIG